MYVVREVGEGGSLDEPTLPLSFLLRQVTADQ
jgi:hypothetical protein